MTIQYRDIQEEDKPRWLLLRDKRASESAAPFWEGLGFQRTDHPGITHILKREQVGG